MTFQKKTSRPWLKWYKTKAWKRLRAKQLRREPFCRFTKLYGNGELVEATVVDHIKPHKGDMKLFFDPNNLQSLSKQAHDSIKQKMEKSGDFGCDEFGFGPSWEESN